MAVVCGIVGYTGWREAGDVVLTGLSRLEYRGYDSAGIAVAADGALEVRKRAGKLAVLRRDLGEDPLPKAHAGLGHTRWATHGAPTDVNAHPHLVDGGRLAVVHNGIIENEPALRRELEAAGIRFVSDTDTEVAAALLAREYDARGGDLAAAMRATASRLVGAFTLVALHRDHPETIVAARRDSPLVVGLGDGEVFLASDVAAFAAHTRHALALGQNQVVVATPTGVTVTDLDARPAHPEPFEIDWDPALAQKGGWPSFMAKEIDEEPAAVADTLRGRIRDGRAHLPEIDAVVPDSGVRRVLVLACGTAFYAGQAAASAFEAWAGIPTTVELAHEFRYREPLVTEGTLAVTISQSGETMDTLMAARYARERGAATLSICNTQGASIPRESDAVLYTHAGPEVAVASTKAFCAQVTALLLTALDLARRAGRIPPDGVVSALERIPEQIRTILDTQGDAVARLAAEIAPASSLFLLGRDVLLPVAREGALKLKETSYLHAEAFPAGELKHGPIALIEPGRPVLAIAPRPGSLLASKMESTVQELQARGAAVSVIGQEPAGDTVPGEGGSTSIVVPQTDPFLSPLLAVVPLHMLAMAVAAARGVDVDQPRNLAKSVTVE